MVHYRIRRATTGQCVFRVWSAAMLMLCSRDVIWVTVELASLFSELASQEFISRGNWELKLQHNKTSCQRWELFWGWKLTSSFFKLILVFIMLKGNQHLFPEQWQLLSGDFLEQVPEPKHAEKETNMWWRHPLFMIKNSCYLHLKPEFRL